MTTSNDVLVITGVGGIGQAIAQRQGPGKHVLLADISEQNLASAAQALEELGHRVSTQAVDVSSRESVHALAQAAAELGDVTQVVHTAGVSPVQAPAATVLAVDLLGTALVLEEFGRVIAPGGAGIVISSMAGHMFPPFDPEQEHALAHTPAEELLTLSFLDADALARPPTATPSAATSCASRPRAWPGARAAPASTPSAPGSSSPRWLVTRCPAPAARPTRR
jgi:NAD(P)-dependent dehydrogenase (short-subunit alcohol dehydrogenase family)